MTRVTLGPRGRFTFSPDYIAQQGGAVMGKPAAEPADYRGPADTFHTMAEEAHKRGDEAQADRLLRCAIHYLGKAESRS